MTTKGAQDTITALATAPGTGALALIRVSGDRAIAIVESCFEALHGNPLSQCESHTLHLGYLKDQTRALDQVLVSIFKNPRSYTGEDVVEISCHGSQYIQQEVLQLLITQGCRMAEPGEFTLRAFLNGKMDLSQAEAVADLIASENAASHSLAINQMRGGFSTEIKLLRQELLDFASLMTLELDFSGEDVEFADRAGFTALLERISALLKKLIDSFALGNVIKKGIPVAIAGAPNAGKSTLLNALLNEEKAIVSDIAGTTRDAIEDEISIGGIGFRFIDTAGIRETVDKIESIGIEKTFEKIEGASLVLLLLDGPKIVTDQEHFQELLQSFQQMQARYPGKIIRPILNKSDVLTSEKLSELKDVFKDALPISAKEKKGLAPLKEWMVSQVMQGKLTLEDTVVSNARHFKALSAALEAIDRIKAGMDDAIPTDLLAIDINEALHYMGEITGEISTDDLLGNIFANFCIGK